MTPATLEQARAGELVAAARSLYVSGSAAEIGPAPAFLRRHPPRDAVLTGLFSPIINRRSMGDPSIGLRVRSFFFNRELKQHFAQGWMDYCPWRYSVIDRWMRAPGRFDTALVMLSPPDAAGICHMGVQTDFLPSFLRQVNTIIGFINPRMPRTPGDGQVPYAALSATVDCDEPLLTMVEKPADAVSIRIAERIVELVPDGSTVQFGLGQIPSQVIAKLAGHRRMKVHSGVVDDNILGLEASGALDPDHPIVTGTAVGTPRLYDALDRNDRFLFKAVAHTHAFRVVSSIDRFNAINSVLQVDLFGQATAEGSGGKLVASPGGLPDFARGALESDRGQSIIAVRAAGQPGRSGGIVPLLDNPHIATVPANDADIVVSEFGVAKIRNLPFDRRAEALIAIAAPQDQLALQAAWTRLRDGFVPRVT